LAPARAPPSRRVTRQKLRRALYQRRTLQARARRLPNDVALVARAAPASGGATRSLPVDNIPCLLLAPRLACLPYTMSPGSPDDTTSRRLAWCLSDLYRSGQHTRGHWTSTPLPAYLAHQEDRMTTSDSVLLSYRHLRRKALRHRLFSRASAPSCNTA